MHLEYLHPCNTNVFWIILNKPVCLLSAYVQNQGNFFVVFTCLHYKSFENTVGKGDIARNEQFLIFPLFSTLLENFLPFSSNLKLSSANSFNLGGSKICRLGKG